MAKQTNESSGIITATDFSSMRMEKDGGFSAETDMLITGEAEKAVNMDESKGSEEEEVNMDESDQLLEVSVVQQNSKGEPMTKLGLTQGVSVATEHVYSSVKNVIETFKVQREDSSSEILAHFEFLKSLHSNDDDKVHRLSSSIHLAASTRPYAIAKLIEAYGISAPDFILSIQTDDDSGKDAKKKKSGIQVETERVVQCGLTTITKTTYPWVTTSCINQDMMRLVRDALHRDMCGTDVPCIGFCNWKHIADCKELQEEGIVKSSTSPVAKISIVVNEFPIHKSSLTTSNEIGTDESGFKLDSNHTHFLFFDGESNDMEDVLLKRQEIEHELSISRVLRSPVVGYIPQSNIFDNYIPVVMLLLGGDFTTLKTICKGLENGTPVVVVRNTGGLADIIAKLCRKLPSTDELAQFWKKQYIEECKRELRQLFEKNSKIRYQKNAVVEIERCMDILNDMKELIVVFDVIEHSDNLKDAVANAMLKAIKYRVENFEQYFRSETRSAELEWCLMWNKDDHARRVLIGREDTTIVSINGEEQEKNQMNLLLQHLLFKALYRNNVLFVGLLMEYGASIDDLTLEQLHIICMKTMNDYALPIVPSVDSSLYQMDVTENGLKMHVEQRYQDYLQQYLHYYFTQKNSGEKISTTTQPPPECTKDKDIIFNGRKTEALYLWFLFMNQPDMVKYLCSRSQNQTVAALLAAGVYFKAAKLEKTKQSLKEIGKQFDEHSRGIIDQCFIKDNTFAIKLLDNKATAFYNYEPLYLAQRSQCKAFLASNTVQKYLDSKWYHRFDQQQRKMKIPVYVWVCQSFNDTHKAFVY